MSLYEVSRFLHDLSTEEAVRTAARQDPTAALAAYDLDDEERSLLLSGEVGALHRRGVHAYLLHHLQRFEVFGMTLPVYTARIRGRQPSDGGQPATG